MYLPNACTSKQNHFTASMPSFSSTDAQTVFAMEAWDHHDQCFDCR